MRHDIWMYIAVMSVVTISIKALPVVLIRKQITNRFVRSFLHYVPYVTLSVMTFPAIIQVTQSPLAGGAALLLGIILSWMGFGLPSVASACCVCVLLSECFLV